MYNSIVRHTKLRRRKFVICGNNGNSLVENALVKRGWEWSEDEDVFHLKWTELKSQIDYENFQEGKQMVNHIYSSNCITTKAGLVNSLRSYFGCSGLQQMSTEFRQFFPETYRLGDFREQEKLLNIIGEEELWICKPTNSNQGKGIFLIKGKQDLLNYIERRRKNQSRSTRIVQRYISQPLLLHGRKFDIRVYLLVASSRPYNVFFHTGYLRLAVNTYDDLSDDLTTHLTNQYVQKRHKNYSKLKEDTVWSMEQFQNYLNEEGLTEKHSLKSDWVLTDLHDRMKTLAYTIFRSAQTSLVPKIGVFDLYGLDFMLDESLNVWLLEVNTNPAMHTNCAVLEGILPNMIDETLGVCIELFEKKVAGLPNFPITATNNFELIYTAAKDALLNGIHLPALVPTKQSGVQYINRGSDLAPIKCGHPPKPPKSTPDYKSKPITRKPVKQSDTASVSSAKPAKKRSSMATTLKTYTVPNPVETKRDEPPPQIPYKLALIEVAPSPKQANVL